jgi:hypothetical protein
MVCLVTEIIVHEKLFSLLYIRLVRDGEGTAITLFFPKTEKMLGEINDSEKHEARVATLMKIVSVI